MAKPTPLTPPTRDHRKLHAKRLLSSAEKLFEKLKLFLKNIFWNLKTNYFILTLKEIQINKDFSKTLRRVKTV